MRKKTEKEPLSYLVSIATLPAKGFDLTVKASGSERASLAAKTGVESIERFSAELNLRRWRKDGVKISGSFQARVVQPCVVTLDPLTNEVKGEVERLFLPEGSKLLRPVFDDEGELVLEAESGELPEAFTGDKIDIWPILIEQLILEIDPFPRSSSAELPTEVAETSGDPKESPFAGLKDLFGPKN